MTLKTTSNVYRNLYIITICLAMFGKLGNFSVPYWCKYIYCLLWICLYLYSTRGKLKYNRCEYHDKCRLEVVKIFAGQYVIFWLFTPIGYLVHHSDTSFHMFTRAVSTTLQMFLIIGAFASAAYFFKEKLIEYTFLAMLINYSVIIVLALVLCGIDDFMTYGMFPFTDAANAYSEVMKSSRVLEIHDVTFAAGFFFIFSLIWGKKEKYGKWMLFGSVILMYFGWKRIEVLVCILLVMAAIFIRTKSKDNIKFWNVMYTAVVAGASVFWIWIVGSGFYNYLIDEYGINFSTREFAYDYMRQFFDFSPFYIGRGMAAGIIINQEAIANGVRIIQGHSDTMFAYIDYGLWGMITWIFYFTFYVTNKIRKNYSQDAAKIWMLFTAYAFVTYLTDNTIIYFAFQTVYMASVFHMLYTKKKVPKYRTVSNTTVKGR